MLSVAARCFIAFTGPFPKPRALGVAENALPLSNPGKRNKTTANEA